MIEVSQVKRMKNAEPKAGASAVQVGQRGHWALSEAAGDTGQRLPDCCQFLEFAAAPRVLVQR